MTEKHEPQIPEQARERRDELEIPVMDVEHDLRWLRQVGPPDEIMTPAWFDQMNVIVQASKGPTTDTVYDRQLSRASAMLFFMQLGWLDDAHPLHQKVVDGINTHSPVTFRPFQMVHTLRMLVDRGVDAETLLARNIKFATYYPDVVAAKMDMYQSLGLDGGAIINAQPGLFEHGAKRIESQVHYIRRLAQVLQWPHDYKDLIQAHPSILTASQRKLGFLARVAADHAREPLPPVRVFGATLRSVESHLAAIALDDHYDFLRTKHYQRLTPAAQRRPHALELIAGEVTRARLGEDTVRAYLRYKPLTDEEIARTGLTQ